MPASLSFFFMVAMCVIACLRVPEGKSDALDDNVDSDEWAEQKREMVSATGAHAEGTSGAEYGVVDLRTPATNEAASTVPNLELRTDTRAQNRDLDVEDCAALDADLEECAALGARARRGKRRRSAGSNLLTPLQLCVSRGRSSIYVTEISSQEWCEMQLDLKLRTNKGRLPETVEMKEGRAVHLAAELEVHALEEVRITSREDALGLKLLNLRHAALSLNECGVAREVPVFGWVGGGAGCGGEGGGGDGGVTDRGGGGERVWVTGVIDELRLQDNGKVGMHELKTRTKPSLPSPAQQRCTHLQLMLYKSLWDQLVMQGVRAGELARVMNVSIIGKFGEELLLQVRRAASHASNLAELAADTSDALSFCTQIDRGFTVHYRHCPRLSQTQNHTRSPQSQGVDVRTVSVCVCVCVCAFACVCV